MVINEKDIEISKPNRFPPITVKQGDNARQITARLFNDSEQFLVTSGLGVRLNAKRSDGQKNYSTGWVNDDGTVTVQITSWMLAVVGMVTCDISVFINEQQAFTTTNFYLNVEEATNKDGVIGGNDTPIDEQFAEISLQIEAYLEQARQCVEQAKQYAEDASTVDYIIEQNSGVPFKVWATNDKNEFDNLKTKQPDTLHIYPSNFDEEAVLNGKQKVGHAKVADNSYKVNDLEIKRDENGVLRIGDVIIPQKKLLFSGNASYHATFGMMISLVDISLIGKTIEIKMREHTGVEDINYKEGTYYLKTCISDENDDVIVFSKTRYLDNSTGEYLSLEQYYIHYDKDENLISFKCMDFRWANGVKGVTSSNWGTLDEVTIYEIIE